ncbi:MAG: capsular biosynthesis protein [Muribaculaceae bacterium]|nr:capsular biosynthesis protein [Muribaculaceae bacterium]
MGFWPFKKRVDSLQKAGLPDGFTDWHSHILPGVDDGIPSMDQALQVLSTYENLGERKVWLTPHIMEDFPNDPEKLRARFEELCNEYNGSIQLRLAAENMLDALFEERLEQGILLPIGEEGKHLLVETSYFSPPMNFDDIIDDIFDKDYTPILAHPERYRYMNEHDYKRLKKRGILFQINMMSLIGMYGETARKKAEWLLKNGMADLTGSDVHRHSALTRGLGESPSNRDSLQHLLHIAHNPALQ